MFEIRHSILVVSYNQEGFIKEALDSVINQSVLPYEVIIGDDCSMDGTWDIISAYRNKYPEMIKAYRNDYNIGLFQNFNRMKQRPTGDIISFLAGDDMLDVDFIKNINRYHIENNIFNFHDKYLFITNSIVFENDKVIFFDNYKYRNISIAKSFIRGNLVIWDIGISSGLFHSMPDWVVNIGNHADSLQGFIRFLLAGNNIYFLPEIGYKYRKNVGVTARAESKEQSKSYIIALKRIKEAGNEIFDKSDLNYLEYLITYYGYLVQPSIWKYLVFIKNSLKKCDIPKKSKYWSIKIFIPVGVKKIIKSLIPRNLLRR
jgi:glycosyltransferase involved in cell wall biosynthesis